MKLPIRSRCIWPQLLLLIAVTYLCHFLLSSSFGLYEDDYRAIAPWMGAPANEVWSNFIDTCRQWPQGRPLNHSLPETMAWLGWQIGGLHAIYLLGWAFLALNVCLVFVLARRLHGREAGFVAAAIYILFPADTTRQFLTHCGHVQMSMTFFLVAALLLLRGGVWRWAAYPIAYLSLLSYETCYLLFLLFPLVLATASMRWLWQSAWHIAWCAVSIGSVIAFRLLKGEGRMTTALGDFSRLTYEIVTAPFIGVLTSGVRFAGCLPEAFAVVPASAAFLGFAVAALVVAGLWLSRDAPLTPALEPSAAAFPKTCVRWLGQEGPTAAGYAVVYLVIWLTSYAFTFTNFPPTDRIGRQTSYHMAGALPACLLAAVLWKALGGFLQCHGGRKARMIATAAFALYCGLVGAYLYQVQLGYAQSWAAQKDFWRQVLTLCPELRPGVTVIVAGKLATESPFIKAHCTQDYRLVLALFDRNAALFREKLMDSPSVIALDVPGTPFHIRREKGILEWSARPWLHSLGWMRIDEQNLILLRSNAGRLIKIAALSHKKLPDRLRTQVQPAESTILADQKNGPPLLRCLLE
ncbi:MAG: hypothetical protein PHC88_07595 [Terrimicrobiaceae bacterium]|nr:hypothetical protein [Terrimicrobiaceae bacterium]